MAQHDYVIDNSTGQNVRQDINNALQAIVTNNSGSSAPSATFPFMLFADTSAGTMKIRNAADNAFIELFQLDGTLTLEDGSASTPALAFRDDLNTGIFSSAADTFNVATGGVERMELGTTTIFNEDGADVDFRIEGDTDANLFYLDAGNNRVGIGTASPSVLFHTNLAAENGSIAQFGLSGQTNNQSFIIKADDSDSLFTFRFGSGNSTYPDLRFNMGSDQEAMRITADGKVAIGTSSALTGSKLTVASQCLAITGQNTQHSANSMRLGEEGSGTAQIRCYGPDNSTFGKLQVQLSAADGSGNLGDITFERESNGANIKLPSNGGISFAASGGTGTSGASTTSSILDDYELGTWTPVVTQGIDGGASYAIQRGWYCRIGSCVSISFFLRFVNSSTGSTGNGNAFFISGIPYSSANLSPAYSSGGIVQFTDVNFNGSSQVTLYIGGNTSTVEFYQGRNNQASVSGANASKDIYGNMTYRIG